MARRFFPDAVGSALHAGLLLFLICWCVFVSACSRQNDVEAIYSLIEKGARLAEEKQIGALMDLTDEGFVAMPGHNEAGAVKGILFSAFRHYGQFKIHHPQPAVEVMPDSLAASATVYILIVQRNQGFPALEELYRDPRRWLESVGEKADLFQLKMKLAKKDGKWLVQQAQMEGFKGTGF